MIERLARYNSVEKDLNTITRRAIQRPLLAIAGFIVVLSLLACAGGDETTGGEAPSPTPTADVSKPDPAQDDRTTDDGKFVSLAPGTRAGVAIVDDFLALIEGKDWTGLAAFVDATTVPCEAPRPMSPQPRRCPDGVEAGSELQGLWVMSIEGALWPAGLDQLKARFEGALGGEQLLLLGVRADERPAQPNGLPSSRWAVEMVQGQVYLTFLLSGNGLVLIAMEHGLYSGSPLLDSASHSWLLEPVVTGRY
jgi:hypothetical protein